MGLAVFLKAALKVKRFAASRWKSRENLEKELNSSRSLCGAYQFCQLLLVESDSGRGV